MEVELVEEEVVELVVAGWLLHFDERQRSSVEDLA